MTSKTKAFIVIGSILAGLLIVGGAALVSRSRERPPITHTAVEERPVSKTELAQADGKDGRDCLVAVDGIVYKIEGKALWQNGQHQTSQGQAYCGADMTEAIGKSPHGRSKLSQLQKIGPLDE